MDKLIQYTGGSIFLIIGLINLTIIGLILALVNILLSINKNTNIEKTRKIEYIIIIISIIMLSIFVGGLIGYYMGVFNFL